VLEESKLEGIKCFDGFSLWIYTAVASSTTAVLFLSRELSQDASQNKL
jgi:hypothetical protein